MPIQTGVGQWFHPHAGNYAAGHTKDLETQLCHLSFIHHLEITQYGMLWKYGIRMESILFMLSILFHIYVSFME